MATSGYRYFLLNKPFDVLCQFTPGTGQATNRRTLADFFPAPGVYPVGRLDLDSEGLLLLTDDGVLQNRLSEPRYEHPRTYIAQVEGMITEGAATHLRNGIEIGQYKTKPAEVILIDSPAVPPRDPPIRFRKSIPTSWVELRLTEGRNRQVRRMTAAVGFPTLRLIRVAIDFLQLGDLAPGAYREVNDQELKQLQNVRAARRMPSHSYFKKRFGQASRGSGSERRGGRED